jgi:L-histidine N-alpha-methyltransferase
MPPITTTDIGIEVHLDADDWAAGLRQEALAGLTAEPKELSPTWLYDDRGSALFEAITTLPEYYPTRAERAILDARAGEIARLSGADTLVELGSGTSAKTRLLLDALDATGQLRRFVPFDVAEPTLRQAATTIARAYPGLRVEGVVGDFRRHLGAVPAGGRRLFAFLGGTIGNLAPQVRERFLTALTATMAPGDTLLLGADLVKDPVRLLAAYDDAAGVTAEFDKNVLAVLNRDLGADFHLDRFDHVALWDERNEWIEMRLRSRGEQEVRVRALGLTIHFADGEELRTEISAKFRPARLRGELLAADLLPLRYWTDPAGDFALTMSVR